MMFQGFDGCDRRRQTRMVGPPSERELCFEYYELAGHSFHRSGCRAESGHDLAVRRDASLHRSDAVCLQASVGASLFKSGGRARGDNDPLLHFCA